MAAVLYTIGIGFAAWVILTTTVFTPQEYAYLRSHGIAAIATVASCSGNGAHTSCVASFSIDGHGYRQTILDFQAKPPRGTHINVIVDPRDSSNVYAARDVAANKDAASPFLVVLAFLVVAEAVWVVHAATGRPWLWPLRRPSPIR